MLSNTLPLSLNNAAWFYGTEAVTLTPKAENSFDTQEKIWMFKGYNSRFPFIKKLACI